jgi:hypothetical protein
MNGVWSIDFLEDLKRSFAVLFCLCNLAQVSVDLCYIVASTLKTV